MPTLTVSALLATTLSAFKTRVPGIEMISLDARADQLKKDQTAIAHIRSVPTVGDYGAEGFFSNTNNAQNLLTDIPVVMDGFKHVTLSLTALSRMSDQKIDLELGDCAYALGKHIVDSALTKAAVAANLTHTVTQSVATTNKETLRVIGALMNTNKAGSPRYGIVSTAVATELDNDPLITSRDEFGQRITGGDGHLRLQNVSGFSEIIEYPDLPTTANLTGLFFDERAIVVRTAVPENGLDIAKEMGIAGVPNYEVMQDPETGIALLCIKHMKPGLLDAFVTFTLLFGSSVGTQGGAANTLTDRAGVRLISP